MTDLAYLVTALWESAALRGAIRRWSRMRYRISGPAYDRHIAETADYGLPLREALSALPDRPRRILDVSTGTGYAAQIGTTRFPGSLVVGGDLSMSMLTVARERLPHTPLVCCDSARLPFADGVFDLVVLQNAPPPLKELTRVTAPGGWIVLGFSAAGRLPAWLPLRIARRLRTFGLGDVLWGRTGNGMYLIAKHGTLEQAA